MYTVRFQWFVLDDNRQVVPVATAFEMAEFRTIENADRWIVKQEELPRDHFISTVFLGIDLAMSGEPITFESVVFGPPVVDEHPFIDDDTYSRRSPLERLAFASWDSAVAGHEALAERWRTKLLRRDKFTLLKGGD